MTFSFQSTKPRLLRTGNTIARCVCDRNLRPDFGRSPAIVSANCPADAPMRRCGDGLLRRRLPFVAHLGQVLGGTYGAEARLLESRTTGPARLARLASLSRPVRSRIQIDGAGQDPRLADQRLRPLP